MNYRPLTAFNAVGAGQVANIALTTNLSYQRIDIEADLKPEHIVRVQIIEGSEVIQEYTGLELRMRQAYLGDPIVEGRHSILFADYTARQAGGVFYPNLDVLPGRRVTLNVELSEDAQLNGTMKAFAMTGPIVLGANNTRIVPIVKKLHVPTVQEGEFHWGDFPRTDSPLISRLHFGGTADNTSSISKIKVEKNQVVINELTAEQNKNILQQHKYKPQPGYFHYDVAPDGYREGRLMRTDVQTLVFKLDFEKTGATPVLVEQFRVQAV